MPPESTRVLLQALKELQISGDYSDLKIFCGDEVFQTHKALICSRSKFFANACEWNGDGKSRSEVDLKEDETKMVKLMIDYFYQLDYDDVLPDTSASRAEEDIPPEPESPVARSVKFYENLMSDEASLQPDLTSSSTGVPWDFGLTPKEKRKKEKQMRSNGTWENRITQETIEEAADSAQELQNGLVVEVTVPEAEEEPEYSIKTTEKPRLQGLVSDQSTDRLVVNANMYILADKYGIQDLKKLARRKFAKAVTETWKSEAFVQAAELIFSNTPSSDSGLRDIVINTICEHRELTDYEEVQDLLDSGNGIAWQVVKALIPTYETSDRVQLHSATSVW